LGHGPHETIVKAKMVQLKMRNKKNSKGVKRDITIPTSKLHVIILPLLSKKSNDRVVAHQVLDHSSQYNFYTCSVLRILYLPIFIQQLTMPV